MKIKVPILKRILFPTSILFLLLLTSLIVNYYPEYGSVSFLDQHLPLQQILYAGILFAIVWLMIKLLEIFFWEGFIESQIQRKVPKLLKSIVHSLLFFLTLIFALGLIFKQSITGLIATTSAVGIVLGIGLKNTMETLFNGLALSVDRFFQIGDVVVLQKIFEKPAKVEEITWRYTVFQDAMQNQITVPNTNICNSIITNYSRPTSLTRNDLIFTISVPNASIKRIRKILEAALFSTEVIVDEPAPFIYIVDIDDTRIKYQLNYWFDINKVQPDFVKNELYISIIRRFMVAGIDLQVTSTRYHEQPLNIQTEEESIKSVLQGTSLFSTLSQDEISLIIPETAIRKLNPGDVIIKQGDKGDSMFILSDGLLKCDIEDAETKKIFTVAKIHPGSFFGEMSLLFGDPRSATISAIVESIVIEIKKDTIQRLFEKHPPLVDMISHKIAERHVINLKKKQAILDKDIADKTQGFSNMFRKMMVKWFWNKEE